MHKNTRLDAKQTRNSCSRYHAEYWYLKDSQCRIEILSIKIKEFKIIKYYANIVDEVNEYLKMPLVFRNII